MLDVITWRYRELISRAKLCLVSAFPDIVKDYPKIRNLPKIFLRRFENVAPWYFNDVLVPVQFTQLELALNREPLIMVTWSSHVHEYTARFGQRSFQSRFTVCGCQYLYSRCPCRLRAWRLIKILFAYGFAVRYHWLHYCEGWQGISVDVMNILIRCKLRCSVDRIL